MSRRNRNQYQSFNEGRKNGWGIGLYRHPSDGWFGGICAGLADYWEVPTWVTRLSAFALFLFTGSVMFWLYLAAWVVYEGEVVREYDEDRQTYRKRAAFRYSEAPGTSMDRARDRVRDAERRVAAMERYVTSNRYDLDEEFSKL